MLPNERRQGSRILPLNAVLSRHKCDQLVCVRIEQNAHLLAKEKK